MDENYILERITKVKTIIDNTDNAIIAILGGAQSYQLDTGQSSTRVTRADMKALQESYKYWLSVLSELEEAAGFTSSTIQVRPGW